jgi:hypothetical protein
MEILVTVNISFHLLINLNESGSLLCYTPFWETGYILNFLGAAKNKKTTNRWMKPKTNERRGLIEFECAFFFFFG